MDADFLLRHAVTDGVHRMSTHAQRDGLLPVSEATVAVCKGCQALLIGCNQHTLLYTHTGRGKKKTVGATGEKRQVHVRE